MEHKLFGFQSPDNPTPYATTMLLNGNGSSGESCTKRSDGHSSGTSSPHSDPNQSFNTQSKANLGYPSFPPPGTTTHSFSFCIIFFLFTKQTQFNDLPLPFCPLKALLSDSCICLFLCELIANWTEFLPPPPEHPPPLPLANCTQPMVCYVPTSPGSIRRAAQWANSGLPNHQK